VFEGMPDVEKIARENYEVVCTNTELVFCLIDIGFHIDII
jgi:hypothetical protein